MSDGEREEIGSLGFETLLARLAERTPTPGGGFAAAASAALGVALGEMALRYSAGRKESAGREQEIQGALTALGRARGMALELAHEDMAAYALLSAAMKSSKDDPGRAGRIAEAARLATRPPLALAALCGEVLRLFERLAGACNRNLRSDLAIAAEMALAAARAARWNVRANLPSLEAAEGARMLAECDAIVAEAARRLDSIERACAVR